LRRNLETSALGAALALSVLVPTLTRGGYTPASRALFAALAGAALLVVVVGHEPAARRLARAGSVRALAALGVVGLISAAWSLDAVDSLRWGLVVAGYAAVALAAAVLAATPRGVDRLATLVAVIAAVAAALGLIGWALHEGPFAEQIYGGWRPGGPFEYPPALALVQVCALPALLRAMATARDRVAIAAAAAGALAAAALVLSASRWQLALAVVVLVAALGWARQTLRASRATSCAAVATIAAAGVAAYLAKRYSAPTGLERLADLGAIAMAPAVAWGLARSRVARMAVPPRWGRPLVVAAAVAVVAVAALSIGSLSGARSAGDGLTHGRPDQWRAAADTALDRPLVGYGADTYLDASRAHRLQLGVRSRYAHNLPLEAWAELGLPGLGLVLALYLTVGRALWRARRTAAAWLLGPAAIAFLATNLIDWPWHLAGAGALWAVAVGGLESAARGASGARRTTSPSRGFRVPLPARWRRRLD
jgi:hypothetical protein